MPSRSLSRWPAALAVLAAGLWLVSRGGPRTDKTRANGTTAERQPEDLRDFHANATARPDAPAVGVARTEDFRRDHTPPPGARAAELYKNAFALIAQLTGEERKMFKKPTEEVDADKAEEFSKKIQPIMDLLRRAAKEGACDWGLGEITFETQLPHLGKAQELAQLALWAAAYRFPSDPAGAVGDLGARARLAESVSDLLIGGLVAVGFERGAIDLLSQHAGSLQGDARAAALEFLAVPALEDGFRRSIETERTGLRNTIEGLLAKPAEERARAIASLTSDADAAASPEIASVRSLLSDPTAARAEMAYMLGIQEQLAQSLDWPEEKFRAWEAQTKESMKAHPLAAIALPTFTPVRARYQQGRIERQMLAAALEVLEGGPARLGRFADPVAGGTFRYTPNAAGFELGSTYQVKGKPLTMQFAK